MYFNFFQKALYMLSNKSIEDYILNNDISLLFEKYDEKDYILLRGIEARILMILKDRSNNKIYDLAIKKAKKDFYKAFLNNPRKYIDSLLLSDSMFDCLFSFFEKRKINKIIKSLEDEAKRLLEVGPKSEEDRHFLMKYLKNNIDLEDDNQRKLILDIIESGVLPNDIEECNFFYCYVNRWMLRESGYEGAQTALFTAYFPDDRDDAGYANRDYICMRMRDNLSIVSAIRNVCHETRHTIQSYMYKRLEADNNEHIDSKVGLDYLEYCVFHSDYYYKNYWFSGIELDAEKFGVDYAMKFLSSFGKDDLAKGLFSYDRYLEKEPYQFIVTSICSKNGLGYQEDFSEFSRVSVWDEVIKNNSYLLSEYPILGKLYDEYGERLSFDEMMNNDLSSGDNLDIFYDYILTYIQGGSLDNCNLSGEIYFNNLKLVYERCIDRIKKMLDSNPFNLGEIDASSIYGYNISDEKIREIFTSEVVYYFSFVTKISNYLSKYVSSFDKPFVDDYSKDVDLLLNKLDLFLNDYVCGFIPEKASQFLNSNFSDLLSIHNGLRKDEVSLLYSKMFDKLVPGTYGDSEVEGTNYKLRDYVSEVLPMEASYSDISKLRIDGKEILFDDYILELISKNVKTYVNVSEIFILLSMIREVYDEKDFWDGLCLRMDELISYYDKVDSDFSKVLSAAFSNAREEHFENEMSKTPVDIQYRQFSEDVMDVISKIRR